VIFGGFPEFNDARIHATLQQKLTVLINAVLIHAATRMTRVLVAQIQGVVFGIEMQVQDPDGQVLMGTHRSALTAVWTELLDQDTQGLTGLTTIAVGAVGKQPTASKALSDQVRINLVMDQVAGGGHLRTSKTFG
jgi:hypothetical protein